MIMKANPTLSDIDREADVAVKTASKVFNGDASVRPYIKDHVLKIADKLNYRPNPIAQALRAKSLKIISLNVPELETPFFGSLFQEIYLKLNDKNLLAVPCRYIDAVNNANNTMYACATIMVSPRREDVYKLVQKGPALTIDSIDADDPMLEVASDIAFDFKSAYVEITGRLLSLGLKKIAIYTPHSYAINYGKKFVHVDSHLKKAGLCLVPSSSDKYFPDKKEIVAHCKKEKIDAVFCSNDTDALFLIAELQRSGLKVPDDVLVVGCDGTCILDYLWTIIFDTREIAGLAVDLLLNELKTDTYHRQIVYKPKPYAPVAADGSQNQQTVIK